MADSVLQFYDELAGDYHLIYADWRKSVRRQGAVLDRLIRTYVGDGEPLSVLDCSCGIGTQAIGLALRGHRVTGTDLSPASVERAEREAKAFGVEAEFFVADLRALGGAVAGAFDAVITCDNSLPHLLTDDDLAAAAAGMFARTRAGGLLVASIRDYDRAIAARPRSFEPLVFDDPDGKRVVAQVWDWAPDGRTYTVNHFILRERAGAWETQHRSTVYRALRRDELGAVLRDAGYADVRWHTETETGFHQPVVTARRP